MAKLNGVKTIDMVNGEITKVSYGGAEYVKTDDTRETAKVGDLFLATKGKRDITVGAFYEVISDNLGRSVFGDINILDDAEDTHDTALNYGEFFRKISAEQSPTIEERVEALEAEVAELKGEQADTIEFGGDKYRKVKRKAQAGDVVTINSEEWTNHGIWEDLTEGHPYKIAQALRLYFRDDAGDQRDVFVKFPKTVDVYEKVTEAKAVEAPYIPQEGDIVVVSANSCGSRNDVGDIGKVGKVTSHNAEVSVPSKPHKRGLNGNLHLNEELRKATPAEVAAYEQAVKDAEKKAEQAKESAKWAKIGRKVNEYRKGDIVKITAHVDGKGVGEIGVIEDAGVLGGSGVGVRYGRNYVGICLDGEAVELITPVDARFDK